MPDSTNEQEKHPTRWKPGQSGNPNGRPGKGAEIRRKLMELTPEALQAITDGIKGGDASCLKIWADRCDPVSKSSYQPVNFLCDTTDLTQASLSVISAISCGEVPPDIGTQIISAIAAAAKVAEVDELRRELEALQQQVETIKHGQS